MLAVAACAEPPAPDPPPPTPGTVVIASFNFDESVLLAEIYAQAAEHVGVPVERHLGLGPREIVLPALQQGLIGLVPEYLGSALIGLVPDPDDVDLHDPGAVREALALAARTWDLEVLEPAPAQNQNVLVVTRALADRHGLEVVSDLQPLAARLRLGGPPECPVRALCLPGLEATYGLAFEQFVPVDGSARVVRALDEAVIDVGVLFSTDGLLADPGLVVLEDDLELNPAEHVVPLVRAELLDHHDPDLRVVLEDVSARLTTPVLRSLGWRVTVAGNDPAREAEAWLVRQHLIDRP